MAIVPHRTQASSCSSDNTYFETNMDSNQSKVLVCPPFFKEFLKRIKTQVGRNVELWLDNESCILKGKTICNKFLIQRPNNVIMKFLKFLGQLNTCQQEILTRVVHSKALETDDELYDDGGYVDNGDGGGGDDGGDDDPSDVEDNLDPFFIFWSKKLTRSMALGRSSQVLHFPKRVSRDYLPDDLEEITLMDCDTFELYNCRVITSNRHACEKYLGKDWYRFLRAHGLHEGDVLHFHYARYTAVIGVEVQPTNWVPGE